MDNEITRLYYLKMNLLSLFQEDIITYGMNYGIYFIAGIMLCIPAVFKFIEGHKKNPVIVLAERA